MINKRILFSLSLATTFFFTSYNVRAQCGGNRNAVLEIVSVGNNPIKPGKELLIRISGVPFSHICLLCDLGPGPRTFPGFGTFCLDFSASLGFIPLALPASGVVEFKLRIPLAAVKTLICCQWVGVQPRIFTRIDISNGICFKTGDECVGGIKELRHLISFPTPKRFPVRIWTKFTDSKQTCPTPKDSHVLVEFNPASPPSFPITRDGVTFIEKISITAGKIYVMTRINAAKLKAGKLGTNSVFKVIVGDAWHCKSLHTSCSKPLGVGMIFGKFLITGLVSSSKK